MDTPTSNVWYLATPPPMVPVPAAQVSRLKKQRIILATEEGFRYDMIAAAEPHLGEGGQYLVNVLSEYDQYRAYLTGTDVPTHEVPLESVWSDQHAARAEEPPADGGRMIYDWELLADPASAQQGPAGPPDQLYRRLVTLGAPPVREPRRASLAESLTGRRLILVNPGHFLYDSRGISEPYQKDDGDICVNTVSAKAWYDWAITGTPPRAHSWPIERVWVD